jgi:hypothetical protein
MDLIKEIMSYIEKPFSGEDILQIINHKANLIKYNELKNYKSIEQVLQPHGAAIILYEWKPNYGHWVCIFYSPVPNRIEFFDSYGYFFDDEKKFIPSDYWQQPYLTFLLYDAQKRGFEIEFNNYQFQKRQTRGENTCGRWVGMRLLLRYLTLEQFKKIFNYENDILSAFVITTLVEHIIKK